MPLELQLRAASPLDLTADVFVVGVLQAGKAHALSPSLNALDGALGGALSKLAAKEEFTGKRDQTLSLPTLGRIPAEKVILLGLGERRSVGAAEVRTFAAKAARAANGEKASSMALSRPGGSGGRAARGGRGARARGLPVHEVPDRRPQAEGALASVVVAAAGKLKPNGEGAAGHGTERSAPRSTSRAT